jgi:hypothetical protein
MIRALREYIFMFRKELATWSRLLPPAIPVTRLHLADNTVIGQINSRTLRFGINFVKVTFNSRSQDG